MPHRVPIRVLIWAFLMATGVLAPGAMATTVLPLDLARLTEQAGRIFVGRCEDRKAELDERGIPSTFALFTVEEGFKGASAGERIWIKQFGTVPAPLRVGEGESAVVFPKTATLSGGEYRAGSAYLLFLYPESDWGFTSPVGGGQGRFEILSVDRAGLRTPVVVNPLNNRFLKTFGEGPVTLDDIARKIRELVDP